jgi:hypothetical protein
MTSRITGMGKVANGIKKVNIVYTDFCLLSRYSLTMVLKYCYFGSLKILFCENLVVYGYLEDLF